MRLLRSYHKEVVSRLDSVSRDLKIEQLGEARFGAVSYPLFYAKTMQEDPHKRTIFLSAGVHGEEPAGVYALLTFLKNYRWLYEDKLNIVAVPCINPSGFELGTRHNFEGINLNAQFGKNSPAQEVRMIQLMLDIGPKDYLFSLDMHEDEVETYVEGRPASEDPMEFYLYETSIGNRAGIGHAVLERIRTSGYPICDNGTIYDETSEHGLVWNQGFDERPYKVLDTVEDYMQKRTSHSFTSETPTCWPIERRISAHLLTLEVMIDEFLK